MTKLVGQWEWSVELQRADAQPVIYLEFGPTAVVKNERVADPIDDPDYSRVFVSLRDAERGGTARMVQTEVRLSEVIGGLSHEDGRLRDAVLSIEA